MSEELRPEIDSPQSEIESSAGLEGLLGMFDTAELLEARKRITEAATGAERDMATGEYQAIAEKLIDALPEESRPRGQIGLLVSVALIYRDFGGDESTSYAAEKLTAAIEYAQNMGYAELVVSIGAIQQEQS